MEASHLRSYFYNSIEKSWIYGTRNLFNNLSVQTFKPIGFYTYHHD